MHRKPGDQQGVAIIELALIIIAFLILIFGFIEIGLLLFNQQVITNAAREGARHGIVCRPTDYKVPKSEIEDLVKKYAENHVISSENKNFQVSVVLQSGLNYCEKFQDVLTVDVAYDYSFLFLPFAKKTLATRARMICE